MALRRRYGFSQRVFAAVLGIGVASVQRYEGGALPSESHAELLRQARDPQALRERLRSGAPRLGERDRERALRAVEQQAARKMDYAVVRLDLLDRLPRVALPKRVCAPSMPIVCERRWSTLRRTWGACS